ncbi:Keratinocyte proline-rich protein [Myotis davidii]|uniref:Keratinocyte proline-rich protein n=1 Tax=Myotis davidii TaxID=225400 RepID=L5MD13_MYODS|nr:Keratinocyte proline-rich protein [Myotis davidii]
MSRAVTAAVPTSGPASITPSAVPKSGVPPVFSTPVLSRAVPVSGTKSSPASSPTMWPNAVPGSGDLGCHESRPGRLDMEAPSCGPAAYTQCGEGDASHGPCDVFPEPRGLGGSGDQGGASVGAKGGYYAGVKSAYF